MSATEFSESNRELRTVSSAFRDRLCIAHDWTVQQNTVVQEGEALGTFDFDDGSSEPILAPTTGLVMRLFRPPLGTLGGRPSQVLALFDELVATDLIEAGTRAVRMTRGPARNAPAAPLRASTASVPTRRSDRTPGRMPAPRKGGGRRGKSGRAPR
jgi:hypothetical protein